MVDLSFSQVAAMNEHFVLHTFSSFLDSAERSGIHKIELWAGLPHLYAPDTTPQKVNDIARQLRRRQMELICYTPEQCGKGPGASEIQPRVFFAESGDRRCA